MQEKIILHGYEWKISNDIQDTIDAYKLLEWQKKTWKPRAALVHKKGGVISEYKGQKYDSEKIDLVNNGWNHDHCEICFWDIYETDDPEHGIGYSNGTSWVCSECYNKLVMAK